MGEADLIQEKLVALDKERKENIQKAFLKGKGSHLVLEL